MRQAPGGPFSVQALLSHMAQDKKAEGGRLTFILARALGEAFVAKEVEAAAVRDFLIEDGASQDEAAA
jgi:3-dehydroquinate synthase